jgi:hypothetical protein
MDPICQKCGNENFLIFFKNVLVDMRTFRLSSDKQLAERKFVKISRLALCEFNKKIS